MHNNPINFNDPTGHTRCDADGYCGKIKSIGSELWSDYKVKLTGKWETKDKVAALLAVQAVSSAFASEGYDFQEVYGLSSESPMVLNMSSSFEYNGGTYDAGGATFGPNLIKFANLADVSENNAGWILRSSQNALYEARNNIVHELGHAFALLWYKEGVDSKSGPYSNIPQIYRNSIGFADAPEYSPRMWKQSTEFDGNEIFADMFLGWVFDEWSPVTGGFRSNFMNQNMSNSWLPNHP